MHIKGIDDPLAINQPPNVVPAPRTTRAPAPSTTPPGTPTPDNVNTSTLSRMMAESKVDLNIELSVRPGRVSAMRKFVELPADFPDPVVDEVVRRLL